MAQFFSYIKHFLIANSRHGTHSPFVYELADQVIYNKAYQAPYSLKGLNNIPSKYCDLLNDILSFWSKQHLVSNILESGADVIWISSISFNSDELLNLVHHKKILIIDQPYENTALWKSLIADHRVTVSINLFHFGILLYREEQRKEDFLLRYPI